MSRIAFMLIWLGCYSLAFSQDVMETDTIPWSIDLDDVVVTGSYVPTSSKKSLYKVQTFDQEKIQRYQARNLEQLLNYDVNLRIGQDQFLGSSLSINGLGGENVKILIDGVPVVGRTGGFIDLDQIQLNNVEKVEVGHGPMAVQYGTDALAGVINIITKKNQSDDIEAFVDMSYDARGEETVTGGVGFKLFNLLTVNASIGRDRNQGYDIDEDTRAQLWDPKIQEYFNGFARLDLNENHAIKYSYADMDESVDDLGDTIRPTFKPYAFDSYYHTRRLDHSLNYKGSISKKYYLETTFGHNEWRRQKDFIRINFLENETIPLNTEQDTSRVKSIIGRGTLASDYKQSPFNFVIGMESRYEDFRGKRIAGPDSSDTKIAGMSEGAFFGILKYKIRDFLELQVGGRTILNNRFDAPFLPSFNAKYSIDQNTSLRFSYAHGFRAPSIKELFFEFIDVSHFILGNPDLQAESSQSINLNFLKSFESEGVDFSLNADLFYNDIENRITLFEFLSAEDGRLEPAIDTSTFQYSYFNLEEYTNLGGNMGFKWTDKYLSGAVNYSLISFENRGHENLENTDRYSWQHSFSFEFNALIPYIETNLQFISSYTGKRVLFFPIYNLDGTVDVGQRTVEDFTNADILISKSLFNKSLQLTLGVRNILNTQDVQIRSSASSSGGGHSGGSGTNLVSPGRRWFAGATYRFGWSLKD